MTFAMALVFLCVLPVAAERSILLVEVNSFQSWGEQDAIIAMTHQKEQADASAKALATRMFIPPNHLHMDFEAERLEYQIRRSRLGALQPPQHAPSSRISGHLASVPSHYERLRDAAKSPSRPDMTLPGLDVHSFGKSAASSRQIRTQSTSLPTTPSDSGKPESRAAVQKTKITSKSALFKDGSEADAKSLSVIPTPQSVHVAKTFGALRALGLSNITLASAKAKPMAWALSTNFADDRVGGLADKVPSEAANATWRPAKMHWTHTPPHLWHDSEEPDAEGESLTADAENSTKAVDAMTEMTLMGAKNRTNNVDTEQQMKASMLPPTTSSTTTTPPFRSTSAMPPDNPSSEHVSFKALALSCVCNGTFREGDRVKFSGHSYPPGRTFGTVLGGTSNGFLNIEWENWSSGHSGHCKFTACGSCTVASAKSRWFTECSEVDEA